MYLDTAHTHNAYECTFQPIIERAGPQEAVVIDKETGTKFAKIQIRVAISKSKETISIDVVIIVVVVVVAVKTVQIKVAIGDSDTCPIE